GRPLVLVFEDLHWSDYSTLDLVSYLARRPVAAKLLLIGTYRPVDMILSGHPLRSVKQELQAKRLCEELPLAYMTQAEVEKYLTARFPHSQFPAEFAGMIHQRTEGNPLFMVNVVDYLMAEGRIVEDSGIWRLRAGPNELLDAVPQTIRQVIDRQIDHLDEDERRLLEAASVAGVEFTTLSAAAAMGADAGGVEEVCEHLAERNEFLNCSGVAELPDGKVAARYRFIHSLYQNVLYERVTASRRVQFHHRVGKFLESAHQHTAGEIAAELAMHFERGRNLPSAVKYLHEAGD